MDYIKNVPGKTLMPGIIGHYVHSNAMTLGYVELDINSNIPEHTHVQEQITFIIEGELDMVINGNLCKLTTGMYHVIPSNMPHSAIAKTKCKVIDAFNPVREDYKIR